MLLVIGLLLGVKGGVRVEGWSLEARGDGLGCRSLGLEFTNQRLWV